jgi:hypothetical protein
MSAIPKLDYICTPDDYLEFESQSDQRHEFGTAIFFKWLAKVCRTSAFALI